MREDRGGLGRVVFGLSILPETHYGAGTYKQQGEASPAEWNLRSQLQGFNGAQLDAPRLHEALQDQNGSHTVHSLGALFDTELGFAQQPIGFG